MLVYKKMNREYQVTRKLQEQSGSYFVVLPKIWVDSLGLKEGDVMSVTFDDIVKVEPMIKSRVSDDAREGT
jgi:antitoxin component of MazEF toxin-antitoxin module